MAAVMMADIVAVVGANVVVVAVAVEIHKAEVQRA